MKESAVMILINRYCLATLLPLACAATLPVQQSEVVVDALTDDQSSFSKDGTWESTVVGVPGQNPVPMQVRCNADYGAGLEARSCFNTLSFAPRGQQQETWLSNNAPPGTPGNRLPTVVIGSK